ncbi:putative phage protein (D protein) (Modular protein) [Xenorhabdus poinarii G6]|uniref:Putative phage protein (D protein) (Modular protein) n=1 Tax=Xenorhabdus poinarii G6 TaxID=1354304 RepID=A0A068R0B1_9GAMM|nr:phage late control D family protein [Xenorhabdus poinarii]CDG20489.1 putative phage protein (D protein) (Modular protein) [Xenorhabdus poinarii G6]
MSDFEKWLPSTDWIPQFDLVTGKNSQPTFSLEINNTDISGKIQARLMSLTLTDNRGLESDQLDIELNDADGMLKLPLRGDILTLGLGWHGHSLTPKGTFVVDEIEHTGAPDRLTIRARSADFRGDLNVKREISYHKQTLENIVSTVAARNKLQFKISDELKNITMHIDQTNESDVSFLTRIAKQEGAVVSVKNGELLFIRQGQNKTASGQAIQRVTITRESGDSHRFSLSDREAYTGVVAQWQDTRTATKQTVKLSRVESKSGEAEIVVEYHSGEKKSLGKDVPQKSSRSSPNPNVKAPATKKTFLLFKKEKDQKNEPARGVNLAKPVKTDYLEKGQKERERKNDHNGHIDIKGSLSAKEHKETTTESHQTTTAQQESGHYLAGSQENVLTLSRIYANKENAERAAKAAWETIQRGAAQFSITLAKGRADIYPETPIQLKGFKPEIDGTNWTIVKVTHNLNDSGFTTSLDLEIKIDDIEIKTNAG